MNLVAKLRDAGLLKRVDEHSLYLDRQSRLVWIPLEGLVRGHIIQDISDFKLVKRRWAQERSVENIAFLVIWFVLTMVLPDDPSLGQLLMIWAPFWIIAIGAILVSTMRPVTLLRTSESLISPKAMAQYTPVSRRHSFLVSFAFLVAILVPVVRAVYLPDLRIPALSLTPLLLGVLILSIRSLMVDKIRSEGRIENLT
jgi:nitrate reductase NapE component